MHFLIRGLSWEAKVSCFCQKDQRGNSWSRWDGPQSYPLFYGNWRTELQFSAILWLSLLLLFSRSVVSDSLHGTLPGSSVHGISQARILERVAISFSRESSRPRDWTCVACIGRWILYTRATWGALWLSLPGSYLFEKQQAEGEICPVPIFARVSSYSLWPWNLPSRVWVEPWINKPCCHLSSHSLPMGWGLPPAQPTMRGPLLHCHSCTDWVYKWVFLILSDDCLSPKSVPWSLPFVSSSWLFMYITNGI